MPRPGTTKSRGYDWQHKQTRQRLLNAHEDGAPCPRCNRPMYLDDPAGLDAAHPLDRPASLFPDSKADHLEHRACNQSAGNGSRELRCKFHLACGSVHSSAWGHIEPPALATIRRVVLICGPPGAGKTTHAHTLGLTVYDSDDPRWSSESEFTEAAARLRDESAQAAVIRAGASRTARARSIALVDPTEVIMLDTDKATCAARIRARGPAAGKSVRAQMAALSDWWRRYEPD